jgi:hypothetical protein
MILGCADAKMLKSDVDPTTKDRQFGQRQKDELALDSSGIAECAVSNW